MDDNDDDKRPVEAVLQEVVQGADEEDISLGNLITQFGDKSFLVLILVISLLIISPLSGIPLLSTTCGLTIAVISAQMFVGRQHLWLPKLLRSLTLDGRRVRGGIRTLKSTIRILDNFTRPRLSILMSRSFIKLYQALCFVCGAVMPFLEFVPFSSSVLAATIALLVVSMMTGDGLLAGIGLLIVGAIVSIPMATFYVI